MHSMNFLNFRSFQCIMTLPDKAANGVQQEFSWGDECGGTGGQQGANIRTNFTQGTTIVFDSFSSEQDVERRNHAAINISKINDTSRRFATDFTVRASGEVTAILNASTVANYRVVDAKRGPKPTATTPPSFSSIISNGATNSMAQSDKDLASSLAACASPAVFTSSLAALSTVASDLITESDNRTDQLRKRCRTMLQQRCVHAGDGGTSSSMVNQRADTTLSALPSTNNMVITNQQIGNRDCFPSSMQHSVTCTSATAVPHNPRPFFAPVLRPVAVQQALSQTLNRSNVFAISPQPRTARGDERHPTDNRLVEPTKQHSIAMGGKSHFDFPTDTTTPFGATAAPACVSLPKLSTATGASLMATQQSSAFSFFSNNGSAMILPPLAIPTASLQDSQQRFSSTDLLFATTALVPVDGLMNLSDICLHRTSDDIITLGAVW
jgi:hypothetical protein